MTVVSNAGPIIALARIEHLALLPGLYGEIVIPPAVRREVVEKGAAQPGASVVATASWVRVEAVHDSMAVALLRGHLDAGESEALVLALQTEADLVLMDEARGRRVAAARGLNLTGTLGLLVTAKKRRLVERVEPLLARLAETGFRMSDTLRQEVMKLAGE